MSGATINVSVKTPAGELVAVGGTDFDDFYKNLLAVYGGNAQSAQDVVNGMAAALTPTTAGGPGTTVTHRPVQSTPQEQAAVAVVKQSFPGATEIPSCHHGQKVYRSGEKNGRKWQAYMCPSPRGTADQCPAEWIKG